MIKKQKKRVGLEGPSKKNKIIVQIIGIIYTAILLLLLFWRTKYNAGDDYWSQVRANIQYMPFATISIFWKIIIRSKKVSSLFNAILNLAGNVVLFIPIGMFLPYENKKLQSFWRFFLWSIIIITVIELTQLFTLRGICDIDDLILNVAGEIIGFIFFAIFKRRK